MDYQPGDILAYKTDPSFKLKVIDTDTAIVYEVSEADTIWWNIGEEYKLNSTSISYFTLYSGNIPEVDNILDLLDKLESKLI